MISLTVPKGREHCADWLKRLKPHEVANVLESMEAIGSTSTSQLELQRIHDDKMKQIRKEMEIKDETHRTELERLQGKCAVIRAELQTEFDARLDYQRQCYEKSQERLEQLLDAVQTRTSHVTQQVSEELRTQYETRIERLEQELQDKACQIKDMQETTCARVESIFGSLYGNSSKKGEVGEEFVRQVHSEMELGTLKRTGRVQCTGYADFTWTHENIRAIVEVKMSNYANATRDTCKFREDVRVAVTTGSANAAMYISLVERVEGISKMYLEIMHGIPVLWVSRSVSDDLSARSLVELAFMSFVNVWSRVTSQEHTDVQITLNAIAAHLQDKLADYERMEPHFRALDKTADHIRVQTCQLRSLRDKIVSATYQFRSKHCADASAFIDMEGNARLMEKLKCYYEEIKRFPKHPSDVGVDDRVAFEAAVQQMKSEHCRMGAKKRRATKRNEHAPEFEEET